MADPATFLALNSVPGILFSSENSLFIQLWKWNLHYYLNKIVNIEILCLKNYKEKSDV